MLTRKEWDKVGQRLFFSRELEDNFGLCGINGEEERELESILFLNENHKISIHDIFQFQ